LSKCLEKCFLHPHEPRTVGTIVPSHLILTEPIPIECEDPGPGEIIADIIMTRNEARIGQEST